MTEKIQIDPAVMRSVADRHDEVAEQIHVAQAASGEIHAAVSTYGAIMYQVKAAVGDVLGQRDAALDAQATRHVNAADALRREAANFVSADEFNAEQLRL